MCGLIGVCWHAVCLHSMHGLLCMLVGKAVPMFGQVNMLVDEEGVSLQKYFPILK